MTYKRVTVKPGVVLNVRTHRMLKELERRIGKPLTIFQGSYNPGGVAASGDTHARGGALDVWLPGVALDAVNERLVLPARKVGFAAWYRPELWRNGKRIWGAHVHMIAIGDRELSDAARAQVRDYRAGLNGLADHGPDTGPRVARWRTWKAVILARRVKDAQAALEQWKRAA